MTRRPRLSTAMIRRLGFWLIFAVAVCDQAASLVPAAEEEASRLDPAFFHLYVRNRRQSVALETATELAAAGRIPEFTAQIQWLFEQPHDSWMIVDGRRLVSVREAVDRLFEAQEGPVFEQYRRTIGPSATQELARIGSQPGSIELSGVVRRYGNTDAGLAAADRLLSIWLDEGAWSRAAELGLRLVRDDRRSGLVPPELVRRTWLACRLSGRDADAAELAERFAGAAWPQRDSKPASTASPIWIGLGGDKHRNAETAATPPLLATKWHQSLESPAAYPKAMDVIARWQGAQREQDQPPAIGWTPALAGDRAVFRDLDSIVAVDSRTGTPQWRYRTTTGLAALLNSLSENQSVKRQDLLRWSPALSSSLMGAVATDGQRVYALDDYEAFVQANLASQDVREQGSAGRRTAARNALMALDLWADDDRHRKVWSTSDESLRELWLGHAFLGPPLPHEGWLYVISEFDRELRLSAIDPATGRALWQQPIAVVERSVVDDRDRSLRACTPSIAGDLVLCPTHIGLLVAVDALTGRLRWVHNSLPVDDIDPRAAIFRTRNLPTTRQQRHSSFAPLVHVHGDRVVYLPSHHTSLFCLSATDGRVQWEASSRDGEFVGAVTDGIVLLVGRNRCYGLSPIDGSELWKQTLAAPPAGFGLPRKNSYLLPLAAGHVLELGYERGDLIGYQFRTATEPLGHLVATRDAILSVGATGVTAYPQAAAVRRQLQFDQTAGADSGRATLQLAEIQLAEGELNEAVRTLESLRGHGREDQVVLDAESLLRRAYLRALVDDESRMDEWLAKLRPLCRNPQDRLAWLVAATDRALSQDTVDTSLLAELALLPRETGITAVPGDAEWAVSNRVWLRLLGKRTDDEVLRTRLRSELLNIAKVDVPDLAAEAVAYATDGSAWAVAARAAQAKAARARGEWHRAEALWLRDADGATPAAARACRELARLYEDAGLLMPAGRMLNRLSTRFGQQSSEDGRTYADVVAAWPSNQGALASWRRRQPFGRSVGRVVISARPGQELALGRRPGDLAIAATPDDRYDGYHRLVFSPPRPDAALDWLSQSRDLQAVFGVFDRATAAKLAEFELPMGASPPNAAYPPPEVSGVPFGLPAEMRMLSPLQGREDGRAWSFTLPEWEGRSGTPLVGPCTSRFAVMQLKTDLIVVDAADGAVLWRRSGLPSGSGLYGNVRNGPSLDEEYLTILEPSTQSGAPPTYRVFAASTGQLIRKGTAPLNITSPLCSVRGRMHVFRTADALPRLKVWDAIADEFLVDAPLHNSTRQLYDAANVTHLAWLSMGNRLCVFDFEVRRTVIDLPLADRDLEQITSMRTLRQNGRYFVTLQSDQPRARSEHFHAPLATDSYVPTVSVRDEFLAIDPQSQQIVWRSVLPQCSVVQWGDLPVPVLVTVSAMRHRQYQNRRWLQIQAYDPDTGQRLGDSGEVPVDAIVTADYDGETGTIRLLGRRTTYELRLRSAPRPLDASPNL